MSTITHQQTASFTGRAGAASPWTRVESWLQRRRAVARITRELESYSNRQLADLGLSRGDIPDVARGRITR